MFSLQQLFLLPHCFCCFWQGRVTSLPWPYSVCLLKACICPWFLVILGLCFVPYFWESFHSSATLLSLSPFPVQLTPWGRTFDGLRKALASREHYFGQRSPTQSPLRLLATWSQMPALLQSAAARAVVPCNVKWWPRHEKSIQGDYLLGPHKGTRHCISYSYFLKNIWGQGRCGEAT